MTPLRRPTGQVAQRGVLLQGQHRWQRGTGTRKEIRYCASVNIASQRLHRRTGHNHCTVRTLQNRVV